MPILLFTGSTPTDKPKTTTTSEPLFDTTKAYDTTRAPPRTGTPTTPPYTKSSPVTQYPQQVNSTDSRVSMTTTEDSGTTLSKNKLSTQGTTNDLTPSNSSGGGVTTTDQDISTTSGFIYETTTTSHSLSTESPNITRDTGDQSTLLDKAARLNELLYPLLTGLILLIAAVVTVVIALVKRFRRVTPHINLDIPLQVYSSSEESDVVYQRTSSL